MTKAQTEKILRGVLEAKITPEDAARKLETTVSDIWRRIDKTSRRTDLTESEWIVIRDVERKAFETVKKKLAREKKPVEKLVFSQIRTNSYCRHYRNGDGSPSAENCGKKTFPEKRRIAAQGGL
jgi:hypothetical protein